MAGKLSSISYQSHQKRNRSQQLGKENQRTTVLALIFFCLWGLVVCRLFYLQILKHNVYTAKASSQYEVSKKLFPARGDIFIQENTAKNDLTERNLYPIAVNKKFTLVYAQPNQIVDATSTAEKLAPILEMKVEDLANKLAKPNDPYEPIKHKVSDELVAQIKALNLTGINFVQENFRFYPEKNFASHLLGFVGYVGDQRKGQYGVEGHFNQELTGHPGILVSDQDPSGSLIAVGKYNSQEARDGTDLILTIDHTIQFTAC